MTDIFDQEIDEFLEHHGVKGMRWGQRSGKQKAAIVGGAYAGATVGSLALMRVAQKSPMAAVAGMVGAGYIGVKVTKKLLDKHSNKKISELSN